MMRRSKARRAALQILYAWEVRGRDRPLRDEAEDFFARRGVGESTREYTGRVVGAVEDHLVQIDDLLSASSQQWDVARMPVVDRNVLRLAVGELLHVQETPARVVIDEAVTLAGRYGGADSPRFVNGILDGIAHRLDLIAER